MIEKSGASSTVIKTNPAVVTTEAPTGGMTTSTAEISQEQATQILNQIASETASTSEELAQ
jgi:hypothetical protein